MKKRVASLFLALVMLFSLCAPAVMAEEVQEEKLIDEVGEDRDARFTDVHYSYTFYNDIYAVAGRGLFKGTTPTTFEPYRSMTRAMFVVVMSRMEGLQVERVNTPTRFSDVPSDYWAAGAVAWATDHNIVGGYQDGSFHPTEPITRGQIAALVYRYIQYKGYDQPDPQNPQKPWVKEVDPVPAQFPDVSQNTSHYAAMNYCREHGLIRGFTDGTYRPYNNVTRAQVAAILNRIILIFEKMAGLEVNLFADQMSRSDWDNSVNYGQRGAYPTYKVTRTIDGKETAVDVILKGDKVTLSHDPKNDNYYAVIKLYKDKDKKEPISTKEIPITVSNDGKSSYFFMPDYPVWVDIWYERASSGSGGGGGGGGGTSLTASMVPGKGGNGSAPRATLKNGIVTISHRPEDGYHAVVSIYNNNTGEYYLLPYREEDGMLGLASSTGLTDKDNDREKAEIHCVGEPLNYSRFELPDGVNHRDLQIFVWYCNEDDYLKLELAVKGPGKAVVQYQQGTGDPADALEQTNDKAEYLSDYLYTGRTSYLVKTDSAVKLIITTTPAAGAVVKSVKVRKVSGSETLTEYNVTDADGDGVYEFDTDVFSQPNAVKEYVVLVEFAEDETDLEATLTVNLTVNGVGTAAVDYQTEKATDKAAAVNATVTADAASKTASESSEAITVKQSADGENVTLTITPTPGDGYKLASVTVNGTALDPSNDYDAETGLWTWTGDIEYAENETKANVYDVVVNYEVSVDLNATLTVNLTVNGVGTADVEYKTEKASDKAAAVNATVTADADPKTASESSEAIAVKQSTDGENVTLTITPAPGDGYELTSVTVNGTALKSSDPNLWIWTGDIEYAENETKANVYNVVVNYEEAIPVAEVGINLESIGPGTAKVFYDQSEILTVETTGTETEPKKAEANAYVVKVAKDATVTLIVSGKGAEDGYWVDSVTVTISKEKEILDRKTLDQVKPESDGTSKFDITIPMEGDTLFDADGKAVEGVEYTVTVVFASYGYYLAGVLEESMFTDLLGLPSSMLSLARSIGGVYVGNSKENGRMPGSTPLFYALMALDEKSANKYTETYTSSDSGESKTVLDKSDEKNNRILLNTMIGTVISSIAGEDWNKTMSLSLPGNMLDERIKSEDTRKSIGDQIVSTMNATIQSQLEATLDSVEINKTDLTNQITASRDGSAKKINDMIHGMSAVVAKDDDGNEFDVTKDWVDLANEDIQFTAKPNTKISNPFVSTAEMNNEAGYSFEPMIPSEIVDYLVSEIMDCLKDNLYVPGIQEKTISGKDVVVPAELSEYAEANRAAIDKLRDVLMDSILKDDSGSDVSLKVKTQFGRKVEDGNTYLTVTFVDVEGLNLNLDPLNIDPLTVVMDLSDFPEIPIYWRINPTKIDALLNAGTTSSSVSKAFDDYLAYAESPAGVNDYYTNKSDVDTVVDNLLSQLNSAKSNIDAKAGDLGKLGDVNPDIDLASIPDDDIRSDVQKVIDGVNGAVTPLDTAGEILKGGTISGNLDQAIENLEAIKAKGGNDCDEEKAAAIAAMNGLQSALSSTASNSLSGQLQKASDQFGSAISAADSAISKLTAAKNDVTGQKKEFEDALANAQSRYDDTKNAMQVMEQLGQTNTQEYKDAQSLVELVDNANTYEQEFADTETALNDALADLTKVREDLSSVKGDLDNTKGSLSTVVSGLNAIPAQINAIGGDEATIKSAYLQTFNLYRDPMSMGSFSVVLVRDGVHYEEDGTKTENDTSVDGKPVLTPRTNFNRTILEAMAQAIVMDPAPDVTLDANQVADPYNVVGDVKATLDLKLAENGFVNSTELPGAKILNLNLKPIKVVEGDPSGEELGTEYSAAISVSTITEGIQNFLQSDKMTLSTLILNERFKGPIVDAETGERQGGYEMRAVNGLDQIFNATAFPKGNAVVKELYSSSDFGDDPSFVEVQEDPDDNVIGVVIRYRKHNGDDYAFTDDSVSTGDHFQAVSVAQTAKDIADDGHMKIFIGKLVDDVDDPEEQAFEEWYDAYDFLIHMFDKLRKAANEDMDDRGVARAAGWTQILNAMKSEDSGLPARVRNILNRLAEDTRIDALAEILSKDEPTIEDAYVAFMPDGPLDNNGATGYVMEKTYQLDFANPGSGIKGMVTSMLKDALSISKDKVEVGGSFTLGRLKK